jgi:hypothetical protein
MSLEDKIVRDMDKKSAAERRTKPREAMRDTTLDSAHEKAQKMLNNPLYCIKSTEFVDLYGKENVLADWEKVKKRKEEFERESTVHSEDAKKASEVFEAIMVENAELSDWLGHNVKVLKTTLFDDYFNGTDMVAEWQEKDGGSEVLALAVDVTFGSSTVTKKLEGMRRRVEKGQLSSVKYFRSADGSFRGERSGIPSVVMGISKPVLVDLAQTWMRGDKKSLGAHPVQKALIEEMHHQLVVIHKYAEKIGQRDVAAAYARSVRIAERLKDEKRDISLGSLANDPVFTGIRGQTNFSFR